MQRLGSPRLITTALMLILGTTLLAAPARARGCNPPSRCADVSISGSAEPSYVYLRTTQTSLLYFTAKNDGPDSAYGIDVHVTVPYPLVQQYDRIYGGASGACSVKGTFVDCYLGNFRANQLATIVIKVRPRGRAGTYEIPAHVYSRGIVDDNGGNNQVTATLAVYR